MVFKLRSREEFFEQVWKQLANQVSLPGKDKFHFPSFMQHVNNAFGELRIALNVLDSVISTGGSVTVVELQTLSTIPSSSPLDREKAFNKPKLSNVTQVLKSESKRLEDSLKLSNEKLIKYIFPLVQNGWPIVQGKKFWQVDLGLSHLLQGIATGGLTGRTLFSLEHVDKEEFKVDPFNGEEEFRVDPLTKEKVKVNPLNEEILSLYINDTCLSIDIGTTLLEEKLFKAQLSLLAKSLFQLIVEAVTKKAAKSISLVTPFQLEFWNDRKEIVKIHLILANDSFPIAANGQAPVCSLGRRLLEAYLYDRMNDDELLNILLT